MVQNQKFQESLVSLFTVPTKHLKKEITLPGQHGNNRRRGKKSEYAVQLLEKQKAKYTYGILERQFRNIFERASGSKGVTGEVLLQLCESRLDNVVFRLRYCTLKECSSPISFSQTYYCKWENCKHTFLYFKSR